MTRPAGSLWLDRDSVATGSAGTLGGEIEVDVAIVGGGIVGATVAKLLTESDLSVALIESREIGGGITGHSTAKATMFQGTGFTRLIDAVGVDHARVIVDGDRAALDVMRAWENTGIIDSVEAVDHWAWAATDDGRTKLEQEQHAAQTLEVETRWAETSERPFGTHALGVADQLLIEPALMCRALTADAHAHGATIFEHSRVTDVEPGDEVTLTTSDGARIRARHVVLATQLPIMDRSLVFAACSFKRSHALAIELTDARERLTGMFTGVDTDSLSLRPARLRDGREVAVVAGHGHDLDVDEDGTHLDALEQHARSLLGSTAGGVTHRWLAHDVFPVDGRPFVGPMHGNDNIYIATGFGGWGLARGVSAALALVGLIRRGHARWEHPFDARRLRAYVTRDAASEAVNTATSFVRDRVSGADVDDVEQIAPGAGAVLRVGAKTVAAYRDTDGTLHTLDAACTHLGCIVHHDAERHIWQCPCHGSSFQIDGTPISGPAVKPLTPVNIDADD